MWTRVAIGSLLLAAASAAATVTAASTSQADFDTAYAAAAHGDTIQLPAGDSIWPAKRTIAKAITVQGTLTPISAISSFSVASPTVVTTSSPHGLSTGTTVVIGGTTGGTISSKGIASFAGAFEVTVTGASTFTIPVNVSAAPTGGTVSALSTIIRNGLTSDYLLIVQARSLAGTLGDPLITTRFRHINFNYTGTAYTLFYLEGSGLYNSRIVVERCLLQQYYGMVCWTETGLGVFANNTIKTATAGVLFQVMGRHWDVAVGGGHDNGDASAGAANAFGTEKFFFIENNLILYPSMGAGTDANEGGRYVSRYNTTTNISWQTHGAEPERGRGGRAFEVYGNKSTGNGTASTLLYWRGGVGLIHDNEFPNWSVGSGINLVNYRMHEDNSSPFGGSYGRNPWDINDPGNPLATRTVTSAGTLSVTSTGAAWSPANKWQNYTINRTSGKTISSLTRSGATVTAVCTAHGFTNLDWVSVFGANEYWFNKQITQVTVVNANTFTYISYAGGTTTATGSPKACKGSNFSLINSSTTDTLTFENQLNNATYPTSSLSFTAGDTFEINRVIQSMDQCGTYGPDFDGVYAPAIPVGWNNQTISPWYEWNNTVNGGDLDFTTGRGGGSFPTIVAGTHYFDDTTFSYTPYTFPHPLVSPVDPVVAPGSVTFSAGAGTATFGSGSGTATFQ